MSRRAVAAVPLVVALGLVSAGCGGSGSASPDANVLTVSAASSLSGAFAQLGKAFEAAHPGLHITYNFAGSSTLAEQIVQGAPVDVFASASPATMQTVRDAGLVTNATNFASNVLEIVTPPDNPAEIAGIRDLRRPLSKVPVTVAMCEVTVPCGASTVALFERQGWQVGDMRIVSTEPDVKSVLAKVIAGEVDAGIVYVTDALAAGTQVHAVQIPVDQNVRSTYPIAVLTASTNPLAQQFADYVLSGQGQGVLAAYGFGAA